MRRFVVLVAMVVPLSLFAAGCGGGGAGGSPGKVDEAQKQKNMGAMKQKMQGGGMPKQDTGAESPGNTPTPEKK